MKQHLISLPHHPKRVIIISLILALSIGIFGYLKINKKVQNPSIKDNSTMNENISSNSSPMGLTLGFLSSGRVKSISVKAGDNVKKGEVLATIDADNEDGGLIQAEAAYEVAKANYQKIINGATKTAVDIAKTSVNTAEVNLNGISKQQEVLVNNALRSLL
ncbi:MAG TPA: biotin/lipoyl-binding protein, partial [Candidatus Paceibacterota bacterium]|nr:biotin/lipoyl-binding protein [Candidatus Paceibacterota bacterium]